MENWLQLFTYQANKPLIFTSALFWYFFAVVLLVVALLRNKLFSRNLFLCVFSLYFYYLSSEFYFVLLIFSTLVDFAFGKLIYHSTSPLKKKLFLTGSLISNLSLLAYYKYAGFITDTINRVFDTEYVVRDYIAELSNSLLATDLEVGSIFLPVGISFFTFQTISYSIDIYRGQLKPVDNIIDFAFYVSYFPQLVAGPIVRASDFIPQIYQPYSLDKKQFDWAIILIVKGLVKKVLISDYISVNLVDRVFENPLAYTGVENLMATYGYTLQIYCDFSGYTDIAIGVSALLGFALPINFNSPYLAANITDFWRRWHISLSSWLRDYLYISMGGNRKGKFRTYLHLLITMLLGGLWHGAHLKFILWGGLHGFALAFHKLWLTYFPIKNSRVWTKFLAWFVTFHFVVYCWIYFRASSMETAHQVISQIFAMDFSRLITVMTAYKLVMLLMLFGFGIHWLSQEYKAKVYTVFSSWHDVAKIICISLIILIIYQAKTAELQPFIYFQF